MSTVRPSGEDEDYRLRADEPDEVRNHRLRELLKLGVDLEAANALSAISDSPHRLEDLIRAGCPVTTAVSILV